MDVKAVKAVTQAYLNGDKKSFNYPIDWVCIHKNSTQYSAKRPKPRKKIVNDLKKLFKSREMVQIICNTLDEALCKVVSKIMKNLKLVSKQTINC